MKNSSGINATMVAIATRWQFLEGIIERSVKSFVAVGKALVTIRDSKLDREQFRTFNEYCNARWEMSRGHAARLISGSQVATNLSSAGDNFAPLVKPVFERQSRPLTILDPAQQREVWGEAVRSASGKIPSFKHVKATVTSLIGPGRSPPPPKKKEDPEPSHPPADQLSTEPMIAWPVAMALVADLWPSPGTLTLPWPVPDRRSQRPRMAVSPVTIAAIFLPWMAPL